MPHKTQCHLFYVSGITNRLIAYKTCFLCSIGLSIAGHYYVLLWLAIQRIPFALLALYLLHLCKQKKHKARTEKCDTNKMELLNQWYELIKKSNSIQALNVLNLIKVAIQTKISYKRVMKDSL